MHRQPPGRDIILNRFARAALGVSLAATASIASAQRPALEARFIGNMAFAITDGAVTLMTDFPYQSGYSGYMTYPPAEIRSAAPSTLALITHRHPDHWEAKLFADTTWKVAGPPDVTAAVARDRIVPLTARTAFGPLVIEPLETPHARIGHHSYIVTWHGRRLYFSGDTESPDSLAAARNLDVAFVSPWIYQSIRRSGARIDAKRFVIYHHTQGATVAGCEANCLVPRQGDIIRIE